MAALLFISVLALGSAPDSEASTLKIDNVAWLAGRWQSPDGERTLAEEHWSAPAAGGMVGMFRMAAGERAGVYELLLLEQEKDGVWMRMRHFRPQMVAMEQEPIRLKLASAEPGTLVFENPTDNRPKRVTYALAKDDLLVTVETERNGQPSTFAVKMRRVR